ncbi:MAG: hypothetical protein JWN32_2972, partial [Solirubrobacterales bacterium]|nr:hypothetical protein [Solirubrobacterales bacterium]
MVRRGREVVLVLCAAGVAALSGGATAQAAPCTATPFTSTGSEQSCTVPAGVHAVNVTAIGAHGSDACVGNHGGRGATVSATLSVTPGQTLFVEVGGNGGGPAGCGATGGPGGFNGGGPGGAASA